MFGAVERVEILTGSDVGAVDGERWRVAGSVIIHEDLVLVEARVGIARVVAIRNTGVSTRVDNADALES